tara:strand:- start:268 stop:459 length:192 start_codon:yes stop_codon:yes gene_type:complete
MKIIKNYEYKAQIYKYLSAQDLAKEFYCTQHPDVAERARNDDKFRNMIDCFLGYPNQNLIIRR